MIKRKVCVVIAGRANYGRAKSIMREIDNSEKLTLQTLVGGSALIDRFGKIADTIEADGFSISERCSYVIEGGTPQTMASSTGLAIIELSAALARLQPDIVVTIADRYETLATAVAASYMNIPVAHTQGGELTGSIDESVRHAITKLSHIHFPATELSRKRLVQMGENPQKIFNVGCPAIDEIANLDLELDQGFKDFIEKKGVGDKIDVTQDYVVFLQHPVTNEYSELTKQIKNSFQFLSEIDMHKIILWPNIDAGTDAFSKSLRRLRENNEIQSARYFINFPIQMYAKVLANAYALIGNSSSAIREGLFLGVPAINIGSRQNKRERGPNVIDVSYDLAEMRAAFQKVKKIGPIQANKLYGDGNAGKRIVQVLETVDLGVKKTFHDLH